MLRLSAPVHSHRVGIGSVRVPLRWSGWYVARYELTVVRGWGPVVASERADGREAVRVRVGAKTAFAVKRVQGRAGSSESGDLSYWWHAMQRRSIGNWRGEQLRLEPVGSLITSLRAPEGIVIRPFSERRNPVADSPDEAY